MVKVRETDMKVWCCWELVVGETNSPRLVAVKSSEALARAWRAELHEKSPAKLLRIDSHEVDGD
jgi:hypothetical protein